MEFQLAIDRFTAFDPNCEVGGFIIASYIESMWADDLVPLIREHGYEQARPDEWYNQQKWLNFLTEVYRLPDGPNRMVSVGMKSGQSMPFPPEMTDFEAVMESIPLSMDMTHRNGAWGTVTCERVATGHLRMTNHTSYSDESVYGAYYAFAKRFLPKGTDFTVISNQAGKIRYPAINEPPLMIDIRWK